MGCEGVDVQFCSSGLEIYIAERLELADFLLGELNKDASVSCEPFEVGMALAIEIGTHLLDLEIGHIANALAQRTLMAPRASELESLDQPSMRQHLARCAYDFRKAGTPGKNAYHMRAACDPDDSFIFFSLQLPLRVYLKKLRVQWPLEEAEGQFVNRYVDMRCFHKRVIPSRTVNFYYLVIIQDSALHIKLILSTDNAETRPYRTIILQTKHSTRLTTMRFLRGRGKKTRWLATIRPGRKTH